jgi:hypothetical protein
MNDPPLPTVDDAVDWAGALEGAGGEAIQLTGDSALDCTLDPQPHPAPC